MQGAQHWQCFTESWFRPHTSALCAAVARGCAPVYFCISALATCLIIHSKLDAFKAALVEHICHSHTTIKSQSITKPFIFLCLVMTHYSVISQDKNIITDRLNWRRHLQDPLVTPFLLNTLISLWSCSGT